MLIESNNNVLKSENTLFSNKQPITNCLTAHLIKYSYTLYSCWNFHAQFS